MSTDLEYTTQMEELNKSLELLNQTIANDTTKNQDLLDWSCPWNGDVGMNNNKWLKDSYNINSKKIHKIQHLVSCQWDRNQYPHYLSKELLVFLHTDPRNKNRKFFCEIYDDLFFHYRAGGNWMKEGNELHKTLSSYLKDILS